MVRSVNGESQLINLKLNAMKSFIEIHDMTVLKEYITQAVKEVAASLIPVQEEKKENPLLTKKQAAKYLGISMPTLSTYVKKGRVKAVTIAGSRQRFWQEDLDKSIKIMRCYC